MMPGGCGCRWSFILLFSFKSFLFIFFFFRYCSRSVIIQLLSGNRPVIVWLLSGYPPKSSENVRNRLKLSKIIRNHPESSGIVWNHPAFGSNFIRLFGGGLQCECIRTFVINYLALFNSHYVSLIKSWSFLKVENNAGYLNNLYLLKYKFRTPHVVHTPRPHTKTNCAVDYYLATSFPYSNSQSFRPLFFFYPKGMRWVKYWVQIPTLKC